MIFTDAPFIPQMSVDKKPTKVWKCGLWFEMKKWLYNSLKLMKLSTFYPLIHIF